MDQVTKIRGFKIEIRGSAGAETDFAWETCSGGSLNIEVADSSTGSDDPRTRVETLTLRGPLTSGRKALLEWITDTVQGRDWKRNVTVTEILKDGSDGKTYTYLDCFPIRYVFPGLSAGGTGNL